MSSPFFLSWTCCVFVENAGKIKIGPLVVRRTRKYLWFPFKTPHAPYLNRQKLATKKPYPLLLWFFLARWAFQILGFATKTLSCFWRSSSSTNKKSTLPNVIVTVGLANQLHGFSSPACYRSGMGDFELWRRCA